MSTIIKVTTPIAITAIAVYMFFKKVIYTDAIYLGRWELLKSILNTAWIRLYIKTKEYFASERSKYDKPKNLEDITKEWLMKVLHSTKAISRNTKISKLQVQKIDAGQTGQTGRLKLEYANSTDDEKMPKATICCTCHVDRSRWKCGTARAKPIFLESCYEFIDFGR